jgi:predicted O-methyltransferase YrrM
MLRRLKLTEALCDYVCQISVRESNVLRRLREETARMPLAEMQVPPEQGQFLAFLVNLIGARLTLEIGVFTGYSTLWIASALPPGGMVVACDVNKEWSAIAHRYWCEAGLAGRIEFRLGPAVETMDQLLSESHADNFDFVFIDADKVNYIEYYERALRLVRRGGLIAIDNVLRSGEVIDPSITEPGTIAIRALNERMQADERILMSMLPIADGLTLAIKR